MNKNSELKKGRLYFSKLCSFSMQVYVRKFSRLFITYLLLLMYSLIQGFYIKRIAAVMDAMKDGTLQSSFLLISISILLVVFFFQICLGLYCMGFVYVQSRAFAEKTDISIKDTFFYLNDRFLPFLTSILSLALGGVLIMLLFLNSVFIAHAAPLFGAFTTIAIYALIAFCIISWSFSAIVPLQYDLKGFRCLRKSWEITRSSKLRLFAFFLFFCLLLVGVDAFVEIGMHRIFGYNCDHTYWYLLIASIIPAFVALFAMIFFNVIFINLSFRIEYPIRKDSVRYEDYFADYFQLECAKNPQYYAEYDPFSFDFSSKDPKQILPDVYTNGLLVGENEVYDDEK